MTDPPYRHIACLVDRTEGEVIDAVIDVGERVRVMGDVALTLLHVAPPVPVLESGLAGWEVDAEDPLRPVREWLERETGHVADAQRVVLRGEAPASVAAEWAARAGVDLLVTAAHSTRVQRAILGSFTRALAGAAQAPLVVVPHAHRAEVARREAQLRLVRPLALSHIVCCVDDSPGASAALDEAVRLRDASGAGRLTVVRAVVPPRGPARVVTRLLPAPPRQMRRTRARLEDRAAHTPGAESALVVGDAEDVCRWADRQGADLIVAGARGDRLGLRILGSFAERIARSASVPVLLVPPPERSGDGADEDDLRGSRP